MIRLLLIEDHADTNMLIEAHLEELGVPVELDWVSDGTEGLSKAFSKEYSLIILDVGLPGADGFTICEKLRASGNTVPILFLSGNRTQEDRMRALLLGGDDYLTKPFSIPELIARLRAILRRSAPTGTKGEGKQPAQVMQRGELIIELESRRVWKNNTEVPLTRSEFDLLVFLAESPGRVVSREKIARAVFGYSHHGGDAILNSHFHRLRTKIEDDKKRPRFLKTIRGLGYRFATLDELE